MENMEESRRLQLAKVLSELEASQKTVLEQQGAISELHYCLAHKMTEINEMEQNMFALA